MFDTLRVLALVRLREAKDFLPVSCTNVHLPSVGTWLLSKPRVTELVTLSSHVSEARAERIMPMRQNILDAFGQLDVLRMLGILVISL